MRTGRAPDLAMHPLLSKTLRRVAGLTLALLSRLPCLARFEHRQYRQLLSYALGEGGQGSKPLYAQLPLDQHRVRAVLRRFEQYRVIDPTHLSADDGEWLKQAGLKLEHILRSIPLSDDDATVVLQCASMRSGRMHCICPFSGERIESSSSLLAQTGQPIYYVFRAGGHPLLLAVGRDTTGFSPLYFYLPALDLVVLLGSSAWAWLGRNELDQIRSFTIVRADAVVAYLGHPTRSLAALVDHTHFAHQIWNVLPGIHALLDRGVDPAIASWRVVHEPIAPLDSVFPELSTVDIQRMSEAAVPEAVLSERLFLLRPGSRRLTPQLIQRVKQAVAPLSPPDLVQRMQFLRQQYWPILWLTVRADTRTWQDFASGMACVLDTLHARYPKLGVVLDGYALPRTQSAANVRQSAAIAAERAIAEALTAHCAHPYVILEMIGDPLPVSIHATSLADCYVAHHGTLQHKVAWFADAPGIVHSNRCMLAGSDGSLRHYPAFAASPSTRSPHYLPPEAVTDLPGTSSPDSAGWHNPLENYSVDPAQLLAALQRMLDELDARPMENRST